jgi:mono/diheme cytochrome c family protein
VQLVGAQILNPPSGVGGRNLTVAQRAMLEQGASIFRESCSSCHGQTGLGAPAPGGAGTVAPALAGSPRVTGHQDYVLDVLLHGLTGPIEGKSYAGQIMVSQAQQTDDWIAAIASYIRSTMTNQASFVTPQQVAAVRARTAARTAAWTYQELAASVPQLMQQQSSWKATASHESDRAVRAFGTAGWSTVVPQQPGMWFQFELPEPTTLAEMRFLSAAFSPPGAPPRPVPYARGYRVQLSMDGTTWSDPVAEGQGTGPSIVIAFTPARARFVRITQTATTESAPPWAIQQLQLYEIRAERQLRSARANE